MTALPAKHLFSVPHFASPNSLEKTVGLKATIDSAIAE